MNLPKTIFRIFILFFLVVQNSFAASKPVPSIGIVVKKQPGSSSEGITIKTGDNGGFSAQLEEGEYELFLPQDQLQSVIGRLIKLNYPKSTYQYDGSGVEIIFDNSQIRVKSKSLDGNTFAIDKEKSSISIIVGRGGATLSGILGWNDAVMMSSINCPKGFVMQNGDCVPIVTATSENRGIDKKDIRKSNLEKENPLYGTNQGSGENPLHDSNRKGWDGSIKGNKAEIDNVSEKTQRKGINEKGLKRNEIENVANEADVKAIAETMVNRKSINNINGGMPNRISMNVTVPKQTQGATFGEKVNSGKINVALVEGGCVVLFPSKEGYRVNTVDKSISELSRNESVAFGEKVNQGLHAAGSALSQSASLLGGALPGGAIISAAVSSVGNLAGGTGGGAAAASYAATGKMTKADSGKMVVKIQDDESDAIVELPDGEYELVFVIVEKATLGLKDTLKTQVRVGFSVEQGGLKTKHDTAKNSVSNIR